MAQLPTDSSFPCLASVWVCLEMVYYFYNRKHYDKPVDFFGGTPFSDKPIVDP